jgi:23S rRNA (cytidine1920-2'-O)/16S rRNA (cytidine1409-2'-O)-methyltransferase
MADKKRVDQLLVERGLAEDLDQARRLVMAGKVLWRGQVIVKPAEIVSSQDNIQLIEDARFVSRGGEKLQAAFENFPVTVKGLACADVGASTGGFTDCLLQQGAARVYSIDVGYGLLDWNLRNHPRVVVLERTNARELASLPESVNLITADVSFISLKKILPAMTQWYQDGLGQALILIKPQFEASREESARGAGVIRDPVIHRRVLEDVLEFARSENYLSRGVIRSPLQGPAGNQEFIAWLAYQEAGWKDRESEDFISPLFPQEMG